MPFDYYTRDKEEMEQRFLRIERSLDELLARIVRLDEAAEERQAAEELAESVALYRPVPSA